MPALMEEEASDLVLFALDQAFRRLRQDPVGIDRTHLVKAVYLLADEFDLPITRCWFKFGRFVPGNWVTPDRFHHVRMSGPGALSARIGTDLRGLSSRLAVRAETLVPFFSQAMDDYLPDHYREDAPVPYRDVYVSIFQWVSFCRRLGGEDLRGQRTHYGEIAAPMVTAQHRAIASFVRDGEARALLLEHSTLLEDLVIRYDGLNATHDFDLRRWKEYFARALGGYVDRTWTLCGAQIAAETMTGPRGAEEREGMLRTASLAGRYRGDTYEPLRKEAEELGYLPTQADLEALVSRARGATATRAEALEELSYLIRQGD